LCAAVALSSCAQRAHAQTISGSAGAAASSEGAASADADVAAPPAAAPSTAAPLAAPAVAPAPGGEAVEQDEPAWDLRHRAYSTWDGSSGGIFVDDPGIGEPGAVRLQIALDTYSGDGFLFDGDSVEQDRQQLSVSWTALDMLELFASLSNRATAADAPEHNSLHAFGDVQLGAKVGVPIGELLRVGGSLRLLAIGDIGEHGSLLDATSVGARASGALDLQGLDEPLPLVVRLNVDYALDNSGKVLDDIEALRYEALGDRAADQDETRHLINRVERFGLGVNRVDLLTAAVGVEVPLELAEDIFLHPIAEYRIGLPINRQSFDCAYRSTDDERGTTEPGADDTCLDDAGIDAWPMVASIGVRFVPPVRGVSLLVGAELGITGTSSFVRELAPIPPYRVLIALSYDYDARPSAPPPVAAVAPPPVAPAAAPTKGRVLGRVSDQGNTAAIAGVLVRVAGSELPPTATDGSGRFSSYELDPGNVELELSHASYQPGRCPAFLPSTGADVEVACTLIPLPATGSVKLSVRDQYGASIGGARVLLSGNTTQTAATDANGIALLEGLSAGEYTARVENDAYLLRVVKLTVASREQTTLELSLTQRPRGGIERKGQEIRVEALRFKAGSAELEPAAGLAVAQLADLLLRDPTLQRVRIQGDGGESLALGRALAVKQRLIDAGVADTRLEAAPEAANKPTITVLP
jgi:outer membrane protein OmpA-like peptidoglycan-associated protein